MPKWRIVPLKAFRALYGRQIRVYSPLPQMKPPRAIFGFLPSLLLAASSFGQQFKMEGKPGEAPGPWIFGTIGVGKNADGTPKTTALKGLAIRIGDHGDAAVCYDLDLCRMTGGWTGGFTTPMNLMSRGDYPRSIGEVAFFSKEVAGFQAAAGGRDPAANWSDPRPDHFGPVPGLKYCGMYRGGSSVGIEWEFDGTKIFEVPSYSQRAGLDCFTRNIKVAAHKQTILIPLYAKDSADRGKVGVREISQCKTLEVGGEVYLSVAPAEKDQVFDIDLLKGNYGDAVETEAHTAAAGRPAADPELIKSVSVARWPEPVVTKGDISASKDDAYVVDTVKVPDQNPWNAPMFIGGFDFFPDGRAAVCTFHGDVFIVSGLDDKLDHVSWRRFASGLYHALGLKIVNGDIYVTCRDGITRLKDLHGLGEADFYERFNNDVKVTRNFHEFVFDLQTDPAGNFYFAKAGPVKNGGRGFDEIMNQHGTLMRVSPDGKSLDIVATGFRAPNGLGISPDGQLTASDNEGTWTPACRINGIEKGGFYGCVPTSHRDPLPTDYDKPLCWLPKRVDNSSGGQVWVPDSNQWGPWRGEMLHLSYGLCTLFGVLKENYEDPQKPDCCDQGMQGGVVQFPLKFQSGLMRARFNPADGQLYVAGLRGWQTTALRNGCLQRVRYTGAPVRMPIQMHVKKDGIEVRFTCSIDTQKACDPDNWNVEVWNYIWSGAYGSPEISTSGSSSEKPSEAGKDGVLQFSASDLKQKHHDALTVKSVTAGTDDCSVFLEIPGLKPVMQMSIQYRLKAADGVEFRGEIVNTIHGFSE